MMYFFLLLLLLLSSTTTFFFFLVTVLLAAKYPLYFPLFMSLGTSNGGSINLRTPMPLRADTMSGRLQNYLKTCISGT
jgi:hypothetical protein